MCQWFQRGSRRGCLQVQVRHRWGSGMVRRRCGNLVASMFKGLDLYSLANVSTRLWLARESSSGV